MALICQIQFATDEEIAARAAQQYPFADTIYRLYLGGFLKATSVGFQDLEREPIIDKKNEGRQTGWHFLKQELYELSGVTVPANPDAIMMAVQKGIITQEEAAGFPKEAPSDPPLSDIDQRLGNLLPGTVQRPNRPGPLRSGGTTCRSAWPRKPRHRPQSHPLR